MANTLLKAEKIVSQGLGLLQREIVLPRLVARYTEADFKGAKNDTITVKIPSILKGREYEWRTRNLPIEVDELEEFSVPVTLNKHFYSAVGITDEELTLDIVDYGEQVARPQVRAVAEVAEAAIATVMAAATTAHEVEYVQGDPDAENDRSFYRAAVKARKFLNAENVPVPGRVILLGSDVEEAALLSPHLVKANEAGDSSALRDAEIGRIAGFRVFSSNSVPADFAQALHPTAYAFGNVAPVIPDGASAGARGTFDSLAMRWIRDYDSDYLRDRSVYSSFGGVVSVEDGRDFESPVGSGFGELTDENVRAVKINFTPFT